MRRLVLDHFAEHLIAHLLREGLIEVLPGRAANVVAAVSDHLSSLAQQATLGPEVSRALLASPDVVELWADDDDLREAFSALAPGAARA
ncbi:MAG: hypothetical protein RLZZ383_15 [Pseudomonadota bacterium]|jgi:hypothetical protein